MLEIANFHPSVIEDTIYSILIDYSLGTDTYEEGAINAILDFFQYVGNDNFKLCCSPWPNMMGGTCSVAFVEDGYANLVVFDYSK